jgi:hypothetical protein
MAMAHDREAPEFEAYWRQTLAENDRAAHAAEAERALRLEVDGLRLRCAELSAALTQARAAIEVRHQLLTAQTAAIAERDTALTTALAETEQTRSAYESVVGSRRWRFFDVAARATRRLRREITRFGGRA